MDRKFIAFFFALSLTIVQVSYAQHNLVSVNTSTGTANVNIPFFNVVAGKLSLQVSISYSATGVKTTDAEGTAGIGWELNAGGAITRTLRGLPDDCTRDISGNTRSGWIYNSNGSTINSLSIHNDGLQSTCDDETYDIGNINTYFGNYSDTEPDIFNVSAPGLSCQLVYDNVNGLFKTTSYQDLKISYTTSTTSGPTYGEITSFTITNDLGITYTFAAPESAYQKNTSPNSLGVTYFLNAYNQYQYGISYAAAWDLTSISDAYNNSITIAYTAGTIKGASTPINVTLSGNSITSPTYYEYTSINSSTPNLPTTISYSDNSGGSTTAVSIGYTSNSTTQKSFVSTIAGYGRTVVLSYSDVTFSTSQRYFLRNVADYDCNTPYNYSFSYYGETNSSGSYSTSLPDSSSTSIDYWGYYNGLATSLNPNISINPLTSGYDRYRIGQSYSSLSSTYTYSLSGADRNATSYSVTGSLTTIGYINGGTTSLTYQSNDYYDADAGTNILGAGIRIYSIVDYDGVNTANNITKTYSYYQYGGEFDDGQNSTGEPISLPIYAFTTPYNGSYDNNADLWAHSTIISTTDLSTEDHTILYSAVFEKQTGKGYTVYRYLQPGTKWGSTPPTGAPTWSPTTVYTGRSMVSGSCPVIDHLVNDVNTYPFPLNPNYDFERYLISSVSNYTDAGTIVSETDYTYSQSYGTPSTITAYKFDANNYGMGYAKYPIYTSFNPLVSQITTKNYDLGSATNYKSSAINFTYNSYNKLSEQTTINSDGATQANYFMYSKDYNVSTHSDTYTTGIYDLQQLNINTPIETYTQVTPSGGSAVTTSANLVKYGSMSIGGSSTNLILPTAKLGFSAPFGVSFTPSYISSGNFITDSHYNTVENDLGYDYSGLLLSKDDGFGHEQTTVIDHNSYQPVVAMKNARYDEMAFSDFDSKVYGFNFTGGGTTTTTSRTGVNGLSLTYGVELYKNSVAKNPNAKNYIFSIWINSGGTGGTMYVSLVNGTTTVNKTFTYTGATTWQYYEVPLSLSALSGVTSFNVNFYASTSITIDDVFCYPDAAEIASIAYDPNTHFKTAQTNTNGVSNYFSYDKWGRMLYTYDQDHNILQRNTYVTVAQNFEPSITNSTLYLGTPVTFNIAGYQTCVATGVTVSWSVDGGTPGTAIALTSSFSNTFSTTGSHYVTATVHSPLFGDRTVSESFSVTTAPPTIAVTYNTYTTGNGDIYSIVFAPTGGGTSITKYNSDLISGFTIPQGSYTITIHISDGSNYNTTTGLGYRSVSLNGSCVSDCAEYSTTNTYTFSENLSTCTTLNVVVEQLHCD